MTRTAVPTVDGNRAASDDLPAIERLVAEAGYGRAASMHPLAGGRNNRIFRVETEKSPLLAKLYFRHPNDPRDRLGTEFAFSRFAWSAGLRCIPEPIAIDSIAGLALFEFVPGKRLLPGNVLGDHVDQALDFVRELSRNRAKGSELPNASEACFRLEDHLTTVTRRVSRLRTIEPTDALHMEALSFIQDVFAPAASEVLAIARWKATWLGLTADEPLPQQDRVISPSDFGFHNAICRASDGRLSFLDFEYAGWDDPAKLACDFFCQPAVPAPSADWLRFLRTLAAMSSDPARLIARSELLLPVYQVKWVCIRLNDFQLVGDQRRAFSDDANPDDRRRKQLEEARIAVKRLRQDYPPTRMVA